VYTQPGEVVEPGVPRSLIGPGYAFDSSGNGGRRAAFARWITSARHPLLARVTANRVWQYHWGAGIVATAENLGASGDRPSHRELLDFLAAWFVESGWSHKALHRLIVTSATYRQVSTYREEAAARDPENRLWWRRSIRRLDAEAIRDSMLAVGGLLDETQGGPYVPTQRASGAVIVDADRPGARRRSVYLQHRRTQQLTMLSTFDAQPIVANCTRRGTSAVPLQSLELLNSRLAVDCAQHFASRLLGSQRDRIENAFLLALGRLPGAEERLAAARFLDRQQAVYGGGEEAAEPVWADFCQMILASNAFLYVE
jgi:hypothetical protein